MAAKVTKKELKEPDFLQVALKTVIDFITMHRAKVYVILTVFILCLASALGWHLYKVNYNISALHMFNQAGDAEGYKKVIAKYPDSHAALQALYRLGNMYLENNQIDSAINAYGTILKKASDNDYLKIFAYAGQGYCYEGKNDLKKARASFEAELSLPVAKIFEGQIYRDLGRIYEEMNDRKKSLESYRKSLEKTTDPVMEMLIKRKIAELT